jgi:hypothetical protein
LAKQRAKENNLRKKRYQKKGRKEFEEKINTNVENDIIKAKNMFDLYTIGNAD